MIGKVKLLANFKEIDEFNAIVEQHGIEEAFMLGKCNEAPTEQYVSHEFLFKMNDVDIAWRIGENNDLINLKMNDGNLWTIHFDDELWKRLNEYFNEN